MKCELKNTLIDIKEREKQIHLSKYPILKERIINETSFLPEDAENVERIYCILNDIESIQLCPVCNTRLLYNKKTYKYKVYCSRQCADNSQSKKEKLKQTCIDRYGVENPMQNIDIKNKSVKNNNYSKMVETNKVNNMNKYGVDHIMKLDKTKEKLKQTCIDRYSVENPMQMDVIKNKLSKTIAENNLQQILDRPEFLERVTPLFGKEEYYGLKNHSLYKYECNLCNEIFEDWIDSTYKYIPRCPKCFPKSHSEFESSVYNSILEYIDENDIIRNYRGLGKELDIFIPSKKVAIECNGLYWHSELRGKDKNYHLDKTILCENNDIRLIHIFEDEWLYNKNIFSSKIKHILGYHSTLPKIYARKCYIEEINNDYKKEFLECYHNQGNDNSTIKLGMWYSDGNEETLVSVMTFSKKRKIFGYSDSDGYELVRFANDSEYIVLGGFGKLLKYFIKQYNPNSIITYADRRYSNGKIYLENGFNLKNISDPSYYYIRRNNGDGRKRLHRYSLSKNNIKKKYPNIYDGSLTEKELVKKLGYIRIWDCGQYVFELLLK